jgi:SAM-dependent methyltransferase
MKEVRTKNERRHTSLVYQQKVKEKLQSGEYPTEAISCFCGAEGGIQIREVDRVGIPHRIVVCEECALMRATPRMTQEAYNQFYNNEYRYVNYCQTPDNIGDYTDDELYAVMAKEKGKRLLTWLDDWAIDFPKVVVDWGCHVGGMLDAFQAAGCETWGIEIDEDAAFTARQKGHKVFASIEELIALDVKADLVIMQDVIEHLTDLNEVKKVGQILAPNGHLYVWTPGFFRHAPEGLFQLAHTYQFCSRTLEYVMYSLGFVETYLDEDIVSLWQYAGTNRDVPKPVEWVEWTTDAIFKKPDEERRIPRFRGVCKFTPKLLYSNVETNLAEKIPDISAISWKQKGDVIIVGGGPSVDGQIEQIKELQAKGFPLITIARMYPWCGKHGIKPDYVLSLDCSEEQESSFINIQPDVTYLLVSVTRPSILKMLDGEKRYIFDAKEDAKIRNMRAKNGYTTCTVINAGGSVTITALSVGMNLGYTDFHVFGLDLLVTDPKQTHATGIAGESIKFDYVNVEIDGEVILTTPSFIEFANQTLDLVAVGHEEGLLKSIKFYGESFLNRLWDGTWYEVENVQP